MITRVIHQLDARDKTLGRLATEIAGLLRGKGKVGFTYNQDHGDSVVVDNIEKVRLTGRKETQKKYYRHSQYPSGLTTIDFQTLRETNPERIIRQAVQNMLPDNRLRALWLKRLALKRGNV